MDEPAARLSTFFDQVARLGAEYLPKLLLALVTLLLGLWVIGLLTRLARRALSRTHLDPTVRSFAASFGNIILKLLLVVTVASMVGVATTSFVAVIGAAGLAIGLALQGSLGNFASGILLLSFKPFRSGNLIETGGHCGRVQAIRIFHTELLTLDGRLIIVPNGKLYGDVIVNLSAHESRRVDVSVGISYEDDITEARRAMLQATGDVALLMSEPQPLAVVAGFGDSSVDFSVRAWVKPEDYYPALFALNERVKVRLDEAGITIPFPQRDLHLISSEDGWGARLGPSDESDFDAQEPSRPH